MTLIFVRGHDVDLLAYSIQLQCTICVDPCTVLKIYVHYRYGNNLVINFAEKEL